MSLYYLCYINSLGAAVILCHLLLLNTINSCWENCNKSPLVMCSLLQESNILSPIQDGTRKPQIDSIKSNNYNIVKEVSISAKELAWYICLISRFSNYFERKCHCLVLCDLTCFFSCLHAYLFVWFVVVFFLIYRFWFDSANFVFRIKNVGINSNVYWKIWVPTW